MHDIIWEWQSCADRLLQSLDSKTANIGIMEWEKPMHAITDLFAYDHFQKTWQLTWGEGKIVLSTDIRCIACSVHNIFCCVCHTIYGEKGPVHAHQKVPQAWCHVHMHILLSYWERSIVYVWLATSECYSCCSCTIHQCHVLSHNIISEWKCESLIYAIVAAWISHSMLSSRAAQLLSRHQSASAESVGTYVWQANSNKIQTYVFIYRLTLGY